MVDAILTSAGRRTPSYSYSPRRGAGVAEQGCLLSSYPGKTGIGGSNPPLSAINQYTPFHSGLTLPVVTLKFRNDDSVCGRRSRSEIRRLISRVCPKN